MELDTKYKESKNIFKRINFKKIKLKPLIISIVCIALVAALGVFLVPRFLGTAKKNTVTQRTTRVANGKISVSISGSGPINSSNESDVTSSVTGKITKIYFKEGDTVKKGDLMFELDDSDAKLNVQKIKNSIEQAKLSVKTNSKSLSGLAIKAPYEGVVTNLSTLNIGDEANKGSTLFTITDISKLKLNVTFSGAIINEIAVGQKVVVNIQDLMQSVDGVVTYISKTPSNTSSGGVVYSTEISIENLGSLAAGMNANVEVDTKNGVQTSVSSGKLEYVNTQVVKCVSGGIVEQINVKENQFVNAGQTLIQFSNDDLEVSAETNNLKMQDLENQLATAEKQLSEYKIYAPIDGIVVFQDLKVGNSVKPADVLTTITDPGHMEFDVSVDELDISKIKVGQKVNITLDAISETTNKPLSGQISKIPMEGASSNGVTTYPVTIQINETDSLKVGMNANAEIIISEKSDILVVPLEAIQKMGNRSFVMIKGNGTNQANAGWGNGSNFRGGNNSNGGQNSVNRNGNNQNAANDTGNGSSNSNNTGSRSNNSNNNSASSGNRGNASQSGGNSANRPSGATRGNSALSEYYNNAIMKPVEVGINNDQYIEITSGLEEGEEVILPQITTGTSNSSQQQMGGGFMGGGMMGGMPAGGFSGGGMGGGQRSNSQRSGGSSSGR